MPHIVAYNTIEDELTISDKCCFEMKLDGENKKTFLNEIYIYDRLCDDPMLILSILKLGS